MSIWDERYSGEEYFYGTTANRFLRSQQAVLQAGMRCLAVADGEGRNGVWLAEQGLEVMSVDASSAAQTKARKLAQQRSVTMRFEQVDLLQWDASGETFDLVVAIFIQFVGSAQRPQLFAQLKKFLKPSGILLLQGYTPRQLDYRTGGPSQIENLYTESMLREGFADMQILHLAEHDDVIHEGVGHNGMSSLIDMVACKPA